MRLYLYGKSKKGLGYTPDWIKVSLKNEDNKDCVLTLDVQGDIDYEKDGLECRVKGDLIPWVLYNEETGDEIDLELNTPLADEFTNKKIFELIKNSDSLVIGIYPVDDTNPDYNEDEVVGIEGSLEMNFSDSEIRVFAFKGFETEINL